MSDSYFKRDATSADELKIVPGSDLRGVTAAPGLTLHPLIGERLNVNVVVIDPGGVAEVHTHAEEQMGYVVSGSCEFSDGTNTWTLGPGDMYHALPGVPHGARAFEKECVIIDCFSPPREGLRELLEGG
jgi:quercetin dioxygenase-like cupin family protein